MIQVGQKVRFDPYKNMKGFGVELVRGCKVTGTVVLINEHHRWFSVEYGNPKLRTSFKFSDIGNGVTVL